MAASTPSTVATPVSTSSSAAPASSSPTFTFQTVGEMFTCGQTSVRWTYVGSTSPLTLNITNINVPQQSPLPLPSSTTPQTSALATTAGVARLKRQNGYGGSYLPPINVILIAGIDPALNNWTWTSVDVPQGWYQIYANVQNTVQATSSSFFVQNGTNTNCVVQFANTPSNATSASSASHVPLATNSSSSVHSSHSNAGAIAGGVVGGIAFLAALFAAFLYWRRRRLSGARQLDEDGGGRRWSELSFRKSRPGNNQRVAPAAEGDQTMIGSEEEVSTVEHEKAVAAAAALPPPQLPPHQPQLPLRTQSLRYSTQTTGSNGRNPESPGSRASYGTRPGEAIALERTNTTGGSVCHPRRKPAPRYDGAAEAEAGADGRSSSQTTLDFMPGNSISPDSTTHILQQHKGSPDSMHILQHKSSFGAVRPMHVMSTDPPVRAT